MQDNDLIKLLRQRDQQGIHELQRKYSPLMFYIIAPILPDPREQEECLSDISMLVWEKIHLYDPQKSKFNTWLTILTRNAAIDRSRKNQRAPQTQTLTPDIPSRERGPEEHLLKQEQLDALKRALGSLSLSDRTLFYRKYYYLQPTAQIAAELKMTERAVEGRLYRLKKQLKNKLRREGYEYE